MKIEHIAIYFNDLEAGKEFFVKYFGAEAGSIYRNHKTGFSSYFLTFEDGARLEIMHHPQMEDDEKAIRRTGLTHIAFSLGSRERVDELTQRLHRDGYEVISGPRMTGDGYYESCILGFEDNQLELTV